MFSNEKLTNEDLIIYKKIVIRHLKELGIYSLVKTNFFSYKNLSFEQYIRDIKGPARIIYDAVGVLWSLIDVSVKGKVFAASTFLMLVVSDERFFEMVNSHCHDEEKVNSAVNNAIRSEINYISEQSDTTWEDVPLDIANIIYNMAQKYCGLEREQIFKKLSNVKGLEIAWIRE